MNIILKLSSFQAITMFRRGLFYSYLSIYLRFFLGLSVTETTFFATFPMIVNILSQTFIWGRISDKYQKRRTLIILGEALSAIGTVIIWYIHYLQPGKYAAGYVITIGFSIVEFFWSMSNIGWSALISDLFPWEKLSVIRGKLIGVGGIGRIAGVWIGGLAYNGFSRFYDGWGFHRGLLFFIASGAMLISTIPIFMLPEGGVFSGKSRKNKDIHHISEIDSIKLVKLFSLFIAALVFINFGRNCVALMKTQYLVLEKGFNISPNILSYIVNMRSVALIVSGFAISKFSKKWKDEWILLFSSIGALIYLILFASTNHISGIYFANFISGASEGIILASSYSIASRLIPSEKRGRLFAIYNATLFLSWGLAGTLVAGPITDFLIKAGFDQTIAYKSGFFSGAVLVLAGIGILMLFIVKYREMEIFFINKNVE